MQPARRFTLAEYLAREEEGSSLKHEHVNGEIVAMAGASPRHNAIAANLVAVLREHLRGGGCRPYTSDQRVHVPTTDLIAYPDVVVVCGEPERSSVDRLALVNPTLIVEVLSPSTESFDRGAKWLHYQQLLTLREYLLVSADAPRVERFFREQGGTWRYESISAASAGAETRVRLASIGVDLAFDDVFDDLPEP